MKTQHTKGPWKVEKKDGSISIKSNENHYLANIVMDFQDREFANALLIAAAPNLLHELKVVRELFKSNPAMNDYQLACMDAAIAKAEGSAE